MWCKHCQLLFWSDDDLIHHLRNDHLVSKIFKHYYRNTPKEAHVVFKCFQCLKRFASGNDLNRHIESTHFEESYECEYCKAKFSRKDNYVRHRRRNHTNLYFEYTCKDCGQNFNRKINFQRHMENTVNEDGSVKFVCDQCTSIKLIANCESKHSESQGKFRC